MEGIQKNLIVADVYIDYIPVVSTVTNLIHIFEKLVILPFLSAETVKANRYFRYIEGKEAHLIAAGLVPVLGTVFFILYYGFIPVHDDSYFEGLRWIKRDPKRIYDMSMRLRGEQDFMLDAIKIDPDCVNGAARHLKSWRSFMKMACEIDESCYSAASESLKKDPTFMPELYKKTKGTSE